MFTSEAVSYFHELDGPSSYQLLPTGSRFIVGISIQQSGTASVSNVSCGSNIIINNYGKDFPYNTVSFPCNGAITLTKTGQDKASFIVTVIDTTKYQSNIHDINIASSTATVPINFASASGTAMFNLFRLSWISSACILLSLGIIAFLLFMKRR